MNRFTPQEWLCAALSVGGAAEAFKVIKIEHLESYPEVTRVRVLHKDSGAVWVFDCRVEREAVS